MYGVLSYSISIRIQVLILFVDDYTKSTWICFLLKKSKVFWYFKIFRAMLANLCSAAIKTLDLIQGRISQNQEIRIS